MTRPLVVAVVALPNLPRVKVMLTNPEPGVYHVTTNTGDTLHDAVFSTYGRALAYHENVVRAYLNPDL